MHLLLPGTDRATVRSTLLIAALAVVAAALFLWLRLGGSGPSQPSARRGEEIGSRAQRGPPPDMVHVPGGRYRIGVDGDEIDELVAHLGDPSAKDIHLWASHPAHVVDVEPFFIDVYEVRNTWYAEYVRLNPKARAPRYWKDRRPPEGWGDRPVTDLSLRDAEAFAWWMGRRLPTEHEWEAAARWTEGPSRDRRWWPWGATWDPFVARSNSLGAVEPPGRRQIPHTLPPLLPRGTFPEGRSALGLHDLAGNAWELTSSSYSAYPGFSEKRVDGANLSTADFHSRHIVLRGGCGTNRPVVVTTVWRLGIPPTARAPFVGFRMAASAIPGRDHARHLAADSRVPRALSNYGQGWGGRTETTLAIDDSRAYDTAMAEGWDDVRALPSRAYRVTAIAVDAGFASVEDLERAAAPAVPLGLFSTDVPLSTPPLEPGAYVVTLERSQGASPGLVLVDTSLGRGTPIPGGYEADVRPSPVRTRVRVGPTSVAVTLGFPIQDQEDRSLCVSFELAGRADHLARFAER